MAIRPHNGERMKRQKLFGNLDWLFFDLGSTLVDESKAYEHRIREIADISHRSYGELLEYARSAYRQNIKGDLAAARMAGIPLPAWHKEEEVLYPGTVACLRELSSRYYIGIIANQSPGTVRRLKAYGLMPYIELVIASAEEGLSKPDPEIFRIALAKSHCRPENTVMIGDRIDNDIVPAKLLGMKTIWIRQGPWREWNICRKIENPDCIVDSLTELCNIL